MLRKNVLRKTEDFNRVYNKGKKVHEKYVVVFCMKNGLEIDRISYIASKKVGNSVHRNRARRLMKESMRFIDKKQSGHDLIFVAKNSIKDGKCADVKKSIESALKKLRIIDNEAKNEIC